MEAEMWANWRDLICRYLEVRGERNLILKFELANSAYRSQVQEWIESNMSAQDILELTHRLLQLIPVERPKLPNDK